MPTLKYWRNGALFGAPPGIAIETQSEEWDKYLDTSLEPNDQGNLQDIYNFADFTATCLNYLYSTGVGRIILTRLANNAVSISYSPRGNMVYAGVDRDSLNQVANEILHGHKPGAATKAAVERMNMFRFVDEFRQQPNWNLQDNPGANLRSLIHFEDEQLRCWIEEGKIPAHLGEKEIQQLKLATISTLDKYAAPGPGTPSKILFCNRKDNEDNKLRPCAIGLGHELIHAYYSVLGAQCGEIMGSTLSLFEFKCVGLGRPWIGSQISENALRTEWAGVVVPAEDKLNHRGVGLRMQYD